MSSRETGERIRRCREAAGLTQRDLARLMQVTQAAVSYWESNGAPAYRLPLIAHVLGVGVTDLLPDVADAKRRRRAA